MRIGLSALLIFTSAAGAQTSARRSFEVATIKRNPDCRNSQRRPSPGRLDFLCTSVRELLMIAYTSLRGDPLSPVVTEVTGGPGWIDSERYDLSAKAEDRVPIVEMAGPMLLGLLEARLQLKSHLEPRNQTVYALHSVEGSARLQAVAAGACQMRKPDELPKPGDMTRYCGTVRSRSEGGTVVAEMTGVTMAELASRGLVMFVGRRVVDRTGLTERFDLHLAFRRDLESPDGGGVETKDEPASTAPNIFAALQRYGLRLVSTKAPVDVAVVDSIERPSGN